MSKPLRYDESAQCWFPGQLEHVAPALARLGAYLTIRGVPEDTWKAIELAVAEALNNAVMHGCEGREEEGVLLHWIWSGDEITVTIHDPSGFMPETADAELPDDPFSESGRGHFLMATLMDEVAHIMVDGHHALEMKRKIGEMSWSGQTLADNQATLNSLSAELGSCYENLSAVFRFSEILATARNFHEFSEQVLERLNALVKAQHSYIRLHIPDDGVLRQIVSVGQAVEDFPVDLDHREDCLEAEVFHSRQGKGTTNSATLHPGDPLNHVPGAVSVCPIFFRTEVLGCLVVIRPHHGQIFLAAESALIRVVADFFGIAYVAGLSHEQRRVEEMARRELDIASSIQQSLLPSTFPEKAPYRTFGICRSAKEVGGDYFDIIKIANAGLLLVIADVMGKGMPAALLATIFRTAVQARKDLATTPGKLLSAINSQLASDLDKLDMFITAKLAFLSYADHTLHYADAGHCPILVRRPGEATLQQIQADGFPLGVSNRFDYPTETFQIEPGDTCIFLTDGIYESLSEHGLASSFDFLMQQILVLEHDNLPEFCNELLGLSDVPGVDKPQLDDRTILVLERDK